jgi:hypothetical protein
MDFRTQKLYEVMKRIAYLVQSRPDLMAIAAESKAFTLFLAAIAEFEQLQRRTSDAIRGKPLRQQEMEALVDRIYNELGCIRSAAKLCDSPLSKADMPKRPPRANTAVKFHAEVCGYLKAASEHTDKLVDAGMHPDTIADARALVDEFVAVHQAWSQADFDKKLMPEAFKFWSQRAHIHIEQLYFELSSAITDDTRQQWDQAASLGREHRPKALGAGNKPQIGAPTAKLLGDGEQLRSDQPSGLGQAKEVQGEQPIVFSEAKDAHSPQPTIFGEAKGGFTRLTRRVILRLLPGSNDDSTAAQEPDVTVEDGEILLPPPESLGKTGTENAT